MLKTVFLTTALEAVSRSGASRALAPFWAGQGAIFCLHHVFPGGGLQKGFAPNIKVEITPEFLSDIITLAKAKDYELLSLSDAVEALRSGRPRNKRFAVFTLDDGYKDNLVHALPVFKRHNCPFTVYVAPRIADGTSELWWRGLESIIAGNDEVELEFRGTNFRAATAKVEEKYAAWQHIDAMLQVMPEYEQRDWISRYADKYKVDLKAQCRAAAMTWDEIRTLAKEPLATIGAHTLNHYNLLKLPATDAAREIVESGQRIEQEIGQRIGHFAYPYGNKNAAGPREFQIAQQAGYDSAVVTRMGLITAEHANHLQALPRVMVSGRYQKIRYIEALMSGVPARLANGFRSLNVA
jgi:peptidoglycan/xylan/chitin deacetylase (PgdA/CDA1 family)